MNSSCAVLILVALLVGLALGRGFGSGRLATLEAGLAAERRATEDRSAAAAGVVGVVAPLRDCLDRVEARLRELESARVGAYSALTEQVGMVRQASAALTAETAALANALRSPQTRGRWGELQLRRVVELAGMQARCDFDEQVRLDGPGAGLRPDLVVRLAGGRNVVVDAKVSLAAYLEAVSSCGEADRIERLRMHARQLRAHVDSLAAKEYWAAIANSPEFVVLFLPGEAFLGPALEHDPQLLEHAIARRVMIATPTTLIALLRTVALGWQQEALTAHAREVFDLGRELYARLSTMGEHFDRLGRSLSRSVGDFNAAVGSLESRVLVTARRLHGLGVVGEQLPTPRAVEQAPRPLGAAELLTWGEVADVG
ncbi:MAG TPA: DNA recombination protein RmuC [Sporichthyaceae bacterium]|nr:DNA recombination protein RmuC [Sporichthyaceae bacterium]